MKLERTTRQRNEKRKKFMIEDIYLVESKLSQGGFGKVYLAQDTNLKKHVVIKVNSDHDLNNHEFNIMNDLNGISGFPRVISQGCFKD